MDHRLRLQGLAVAAALAMGSATAWALPGKTAATIETESPEPPSSAAASAEDDRAALNAELFYEILVGEIAASEGALGDAQAMMMEAARTSGSEQLYRRGTELALQSRSGERALANARAWLDAFPQSRDANRFVLQILVALNRIADTGSYLKREIEATPAPSKPATYLGITQLYNNASDKALAADVVEQAMAGETDNPASGPLAWATIGHMRLGAGQKAAAMQAVQKAQALTPDTGPVALLSMELLEAGMPEAEPIVKRYLPACCWASSAWTRPASSWSPSPWIPPTTPKPGPPWPRCSCSPTMWTQPRRPPSASASSCRRFPPVWRAAQPSPSTTCCSPRLQKSRASSPRPTPCCAASTTRPTC